MMPVCARRVSVGAAFLFVLWSASAGAWGADGHRVIGEIAWLSLDPATRDRVKELLPQGRYQTLSEASVWADRYARGRKQYAWLEPLHYVDLDYRATQVVIDSVNCPRGNCVIEAIPRFARVLEDSTATRDAQIEALRLLAHFVGDVHQPLHVAYADTCGGCTVRLQTPGGWTSLHQFWDSGLLEEDLKRRYENEDATELSDEEIMTNDVTPHWRLLARELVKGTTGQFTLATGPITDSTLTLNVRENGDADLDPRAWAEESLRLAQSPLFQISREVSNGYVDQAIPVMEARLREAGLRLAAVLNAVYSGRRLFSKGTP
jgi:S1/P1 Nuclease